MVIANSKGECQDHGGGAKISEDVPLTLRRGCGREGGLELMLPTCSAKQPREGFLGGWNNCIIGGSPEDQGGRSL